MNLILLGAPGAGKGTQADVICEKRGIPAISTGNLLRTAVKEQTELGKAAQVYMDQGQLVPDEVVIAMLGLRLVEDDCKNGFVLDGFPRTVFQAEALDRMGINVDRVIDIEVDDESIASRMSGRRVCLACGASYHLSFHAPKAEGVCDKCGAGLVLRKDDEPATVRERLQVYHELTEPLIAYYRKQNKLHVVAGQEDIKDTTVLVLKALEA